MTITPSAVATRRYKAFVSYSHAADGKLAPALQSALQRFTKPWYRLRAMRIFRDQTGLAVTPALWPDIEAALQESEYFILLASPQSATSKWVQDEVAWWLKNRTADRLLIVLTDGEISWNEGASDFDWTRTNALPQCLQGAYTEVPHFGNLSWAKNEIDLSLRRPLFLEEIAKLTATLLHRPLDDIFDENIAQHRRAMRMLGAAVVTLFVLTVAALGTAYVTFQLAAERRAVLDRQRQEAELLHETQRREAASVELAAQAAAVLEQDPELSRRLAVEAVRIAPTREAKHALRQTLLGLVAPLVAPVILQGHPEAVYSVHFSPDGQRVLTGSDDGTVRLWDATTGTNVWTRKVCEAGRGWAAASLSADGKKVLTVVKPESLRRGFWDSGAVQLRDAGTGDLLISVPDRDAVTAALRSDGSEIVTAGFLRTVRVWDALTGKLRAELSGHEHRIPSATFSANGNWLVTGSWDGTARVWDATTGESLAVLQPPNAVASAVFTPDGTRVVTLGDDRRDLRLWDWANAPGNSAALFTGREGSIQDLAVSRDGKWLATASTDNTAMIFETASGNCLQVLRGHEDFVNGVDFSPDGELVVTASADKTARVWEVATGEELTQLGWNHSARTGVTFSPDGRRIATGTFEGAVPVYSCAICGSVSDLVALALARTTRELTDVEKEKYLRGLP